MSERAIIGWQSPKVSEKLRAGAGSHDKAMYEVAKEIAKEFEEKARKIGATPGKYSFEEGDNAVKG